MICAVTLTMKQLLLVRMANVFTLFDLVELGVSPNKFWHKGRSSRHFKAQADQENCAIWFYLKRINLNETKTHRTRKSIQNWTKARRKFSDYGCICDDELLDLACWANSARCKTSLCACCIKSTTDQSMGWLVSGCSPQTALANGFQFEFQNFDIVWKWSSDFSLSTILSWVILELLERRIWLTCLSKKTSYHFQDLNCFFIFLSKFSLFIGRRIGKTIWYKYEKARSKRWVRFSVDFSNTLRSNFLLSWALCSCSFVIASR